LWLPQCTDVKDVQRIITDIVGEVLMLISFNKAEEACDGDRGEMRGAEE
jgi:hypothetical protein